MPTQQPNIVFIMADDLGCCDLGCYGNKDVRTPHLDALAAESLRHEAYYVTPVCAPTRAALLTGRHHLRTGVSHVHGGLDFLNLNETTIAETLRNAGYATGMWGKWHSGVENGYLPEQRGFDEAKRLRLYKHRNPVLLEGGVITENPDAWGDDVIVNHCLEFARKHADQPFFAYVPSMSPHGPLDGPDHLVAQYLERGLTEKLAKHYALVECLDTAVGRLVQGLRDLPTDRETIIVFSSDNGPAMHEGLLTDDERARRNGLDWRGWKGDVWEAGIRAPLFIHAPQRFAARVERQVADVMDLYPTFCAWAGAEFLPQQLPLDGRDVTPMLHGESMSEKAVFSWVHPAIPPYEGPRTKRDALNEYRPIQPQEVSGLKAPEQVMAVRQGDWKFLRNADINNDQPASGSEHLMNVVEDPRECCDQLKEEQAQAYTLRSQLDNWWHEICQEPGAFLAPCLQIPANGDYQFKATACSDLSGHLRNDVSAIHNIQQPGDMIAWHVYLEQPRTFTVQLLWQHDHQPAVDSRLRLQSGDAWIEGVVVTKGDALSIAWDDALTIDAGASTLTLHIQKWCGENACSLQQVLCMETAAQVS